VRPPPPRLQALGIATKINKGTIEIIAAVHLVHVGERVSASQATLLGKLGIRPFQYGLVLVKVGAGGLSSSHVLQQGAAWRGAPPPARSTPPLGSQGPALQWPARADAIASGGSGGSAQAAGRGRRAAGRAPALTPHPPAPPAAALQVFESGSLFDPAILEITDEDMLGAVAAAVANIASISLAVDYPTLAAVPHVVINGYKNVLAIAVETDYSFPLADKVRARADGAGLVCQAAAAAAQLLLQRPGCALIRG
jgi:hypothetical protein